MNDNKSVIEAHDIEHRIINLEYKNERKINDISIQMEEERQKMFD